MARPGGDVVDRVRGVAAAGAIVREVGLVDRTDVEASPLSEIIDLPWQTVSDQRLANQKVGIPNGSIFAGGNLA